MNSRVSLKEKKLPIDGGDGYHTRQVNVHLLISPANPAEMSMIHHVQRKSLSSNRHSQYL